MDRGYRKMLYRKGKADEKIFSISRRLKSEGTREKSDPSPLSCVPSLRQLKGTLFPTIRLW